MTSRLRLIRIIPNVGQPLRCLSIQQQQQQQQQQPKRTPLYELHQSQDGKMVPFAGFLLPVSYGSVGIADSHKHTRQGCSVFDVSHMMQTLVRGKDRIELIERLTPADVQGLGDNRSTLTVFTDPITGGILDDLIVTKTPLGYLHLVSNASRRAHDLALLNNKQREMSSEGKDVEVEIVSPSDSALVAIQGPEAAKCLQPLVDVDLGQLGFMSSTLTTVDGAFPHCRLTRCGYTGEDGFEMVIRARDAQPFVHKLLATSDHVKMAGLGARDTLRLEAGLCLYGNDIDHTTTPVEASLSWLIAKRRRQSADFPGAKIILDQLKNGPLRRRVGVKFPSGPVPRTGVKLYCPDSEERMVGHVTSGCPSPSLGGNIAMGYVQKDLSKIGTQLVADVRGKKVKAEIIKMPFVPAKYYHLIK